MHLSSECEDTMEHSRAIQNGRPKMVWAGVSTMTEMTKLSSRITTTFPALVHSRSVLGSISRELQAMRMAQGLFQRQMPQPETITDFTKMLPIIRSMYVGVSLDSSKSQARFSHRLMSGIYSSVPGTVARYTCTSTGSLTTPARQEPHLPITMTILALAVTSTMRQRAILTASLETCESTDDAYLRQRSYASTSQRRDGNCMKSLRSGASRHRRYRRPAVRHPAAAVQARHRFQVRRQVRAIPAVHRAIQARRPRPRRQVLAHRAIQAHRPAIRPVPVVRQVQARRPAAIRVRAAATLAPALAPRLRRPARPAIQVRRRPILAPAAAHPAIRVRHHPTLARPVRRHHRPHHRLPIHPARAATLAQVQAHRHPVAAILARQAHRLILALAVHLAQVQARQVILAHRQAAAIVPAVRPAVIVPVRRHPASQAVLPVHACRETAARTGPGSGSMRRPFVQRQGD